MNKLGFPSDICMNFRLQKYRIYIKEFDSDIALRKFRIKAR